MAKMAKMGKSSLTANSESPYKADFDKAVASLESKVSSLFTAQTFSELSQKERECRDALFALQHYSLGLGYWVKQTVDIRRQQINRNATISSDFLHQALTEDPHDSVPVSPKSKKTSTTKTRTKTRKKTETSE